MTLCKLSLRNARRQAKDYLVYFVTIVLAAALVHAFNGLVFSQELRNLSAAMDSLGVITVLTSVVVVCIIGWLVQYTTGFMLARRSRELGTYILIGLENKQVARLFLLENLAVGGVAFALGILLGNLLFQALRAITLTLFHAPYTFSLSFSAPAVGLTVLYFALIYMLALFRGRRRIRNMKICDLIYFDRKNEGEVIKKARNRRAMFAVSIVFGIIGLLLLLLRSFWPGILGSFFIIVFFYGFFISFSSGVPAYFEKHVARKYRGQTLLVFRTLSAKLATMGVVMATIALLFTATLVSEGMGLLFHTMFQTNAAQTTCFDLFVSSGGPPETCLNKYRAYVNENIPVRAARQYAVYAGENANVTNYLLANADYWAYDDFDTLMKASDYTALRSMLGYPEVSLQPGQYFIHCMDYLGKALEGYSEVLTVGGQTLTPGGVFTESFTQYMWDGNGRGFILVVPDEIAAARPVSHSIYAAMTPEPVPVEHFVSLSDIREAMDYETQGYNTIFMQASVNAENASFSAMIVFPLFYLALVLTMVSATILTIQQLSETARYRRQFALLHKLGMDRREMKRALRRQFAIYYAMPAIPPLIISIPLLIAMGNAMDPGIFTSIGHLLMLIGVTIALFMCIYLLYILMAYTSLKRNALPE